ncbi:MAG: hypothetical protein ACTTIC_08395 [Helicobacteraceae bacterium]
MASRKYIPYTRSAYGWMRSTGFSRFSRTCVFIQIFKFAYYNLKILRALNDMEKHH